MPTYVDSPASAWEEFTVTDEAAAVIYEDSAPSAWEEFTTTDAPPDDSYTDSAPSAFVTFTIRNDPDAISYGDSAPSGYVQFDIVANPASNTPPVANAGANQSKLPFDPVTLNGSGSSDVDGALPDSAFVWTQTAGYPVTLVGVGPLRTFEAPGTFDGTTLTFQLDVTDLGGLTSTASTTVSVGAHDIFYWNEDVSEWRAVEVTWL